MVSLLLLLLLLLLLPLCLMVGEFCFADGAATICVDFSESRRLLQILQCAAFS